ncbi:uncharacterized protein PHALS_08780 [Plasmopara halstedii]|uniref:Glycoside hydrolase 131 catalytic N-terminal domain-containing protein n=1 Tax=Plasmopara halstedii TaxID=4781 RepID=A0A0N7L4H9_PLAHL|nr:uncharacterized protein PHALS_08780 [Plasmopara halstedii]CEG38723.1 hypothetical protein PHALS_08780 [Plasmopara halstedii]|eukprot:XP_024575092.1 hypothetical protein PHALS_08780 [Plasmopara halstedii]
MVFSSAMLGVAALVSAYFAAPATAADQPLPWDGLGVGLTATTLEKKYMTHILTQRNGGQNGKPADYVTIKQDARPSYNGDTAVIDISVDAKAIFQKQQNFRRSELVQMIAGNPKGVTFFRISVMKEDAFLNPYAWQCIFTESHIFEIRFDASLTTTKLIYLNGGTYDPKWETDFKPGTWYNFGIGLAPSSTGYTLEFYMSEGDADLVLERTDEIKSELPTSHEFHYGALTLSSDGSEPKMAAKPDTLSYNGVTVSDEVSLTGGGSGGSSTKSGSSKTEDSPTPSAPTPSTDTPASDADTPSVMTKGDSPSETPSMESGASKSCARKRNR